VVTNIVAIGSEQEKHRSLTFAIATFICQDELLAPRNHVIHSHWRVRRSRLRD